MAKPKILYWITIYNICQRIYLSYAQVAWKLIENQPRDKDLIGSSSGQILKFRQFIFDLLPAVID